MKDLLKTYYQLPIGALSGNLDTVTVDEKNKSLFDKLMPNYSPKMSLQDFMNGMWPYSKTLLQDKRSLPNSGSKLLLT